MAEWMNMERRIGFVLNASQMKGGRSVAEVNEFFFKGFPDERRAFWYL